LIWEFILLAGAALFLLCVPVAAWVLLSARTEHQLGRRRKPRRTVSGAFIGLLIFAVFFAVRQLFSSGHKHAASSHAPGSAGSGGALKPTPPAHVPFDWLPAIAVLSIAVVGACVIAYVLFRPHTPRSPSRAQLAFRLSTLLDESLDDLRAERDPRTAVIATYARMERSLAGAGLPRSVAEAPLEYLGRVLRELLETSADAVARLTALFERAKFSPHAIDRGMKDEAIDALVAVRDELRTVEP
jgi:hypothetical protein